MAIKLPDISPFKVRVAEIDALMTASDFYSDARRSASLSREHIKLVLLPEQLKKMTLFSLLGLPLFAVGLGTIVLWRRRR